MSRRAPLLALALLLAGCIEQAPEDAATAASPSVDLYEFVFDFPAPATQPREAGDSVTFDVGPEFKHVRVSHTFERREASVDGEYALELSTPNGRLACSMGTWVATPTDAREEGCELRSSGEPGTWRINATARGDHRIHVLVELS